MRLTPAMQLLGCGEGALDRSDGTSSDDSGCSDTKHSEESAAVLGERLPLQGKSNASLSIERSSADERMVYSIARRDVAADDVGTDGKL